jgi:hypothetical protein
MLHNYKGTDKNSKPQAVIFVLGRAGGENCIKVTQGKIYSNELAPRNILRKC